jgi:hypothetical protein
MVTLAIVLVFAAVALVLYTGRSTIIPLVQSNRRIVTAWGVLTATALAAYPSMAQEAAPEPQINIPLDTLFGSINTWIEVFLPIVAIGGGIMIALALLNMVVNMIRKALGGGGK